MPGRRTPRGVRSHFAIALGKVVRDCRVERGISSQEHLAELSGLSKNNIGCIERGEVDTTLDSLRRIAKAFGVNASDLLRMAGS
jgi:transcriptional regulator with XRE-family HTH domain